VASETKATKRPSAEIANPVRPLSLLACLPLDDTLTRSVAPA